MEKFIVRFKEAGVWFDITKEPVSKEKAEEIYDQQTYYKHMFVKQDEKLFFHIKQVGE